MKVVKCDQCNKTFSFKVVANRLSEGVESLTFTCPHCNHMYIGVIADDDIKGWQKEVRILQLTKPTNKKHDEEITHKLGLLGLQIKSRMDQLKAKYYRGNS